MKEGKVGKLKAEKNKFIEKIFSSDINLKQFNNKY